MNRFTFTGHAFADGRAPDGANGGPKAEIRIAVNRGYKDRRTGEWVEREPLGVRIGCWFEGRTTNLILQTRAGDGVVVEGAIDGLSTWMSRPDDGSQPQPRAELQLRNPDTYDLLQKISTGRSDAAPAQPHAQQSAAPAAPQAPDLDSIV